MVATSESKYRVIGTRPIRHDGLEKVTGRALYGADIRMGDLALGAVLRSPYAHANIKSIDVSAAEAMPGVLGVITGKDMPIAKSGTVDLLEEGNVGLKFASNRVMAGDKVVFKGHPVAAVAATDMNTALEAAAAINVVYEVLEPVLSVRQAIGDGAPILHDDLVGNHLGEPVSATNIADHFRHELGDPDQGFSDAAIVIEREFDIASAHQGYLEMQTSTAFWAPDGKITIWTSTQGSFNAREQISGVLNIPPSQIKVVPMEIGGGFGGKIPVYLEPSAAVLSRKIGRPVRLSMSRKDVFEASGPGAGAVIGMKIGVDANGKIIAAAGDLRYEAGAYPGSPVAAGAECCFSAYNIPNVRIDGFDIVVTKPKTAAYRAPGSTHVAYAVESVVDEICKEIGMDPFEFRLLNASKQGDRRAVGPIFGKIGTTEVLEAARDSIHNQTPIEQSSNPNIKRGRGIGIGFWRNAGRKSTVTLSVNRDATVALIEGSTDIGGTRASIAMQAAEVLGIPAEKMKPTIVDTDLVGYTDATGGSRTTYATGHAAYDAATAVVAEMGLRAAMLWEVDPDSIIHDQNGFSSKFDPELNISFEDLAGRLEGTGGPVSITATVDLTLAEGTFGVHVADIEIDTETGKSDIIRYTVVQDVGKAIHPAYVEGQLQGGAAQGIGWALNEEYFMDAEGSMVNSSFLDYRMPTSLDLPDIETILVEVENPLHPFGVKGVGEVTIAPPIGAISNAINDALGVRLRSAPMKPSRILEGLGVISAD